MTLAIPSHKAVMNLRTPCINEARAEGLEFFRGLTGVRPDEEFLPCGRDADEVRGRVFADDGEAI